MCIYTKQSVPDKRGSILAQIIKHYRKHNTIAQLFYVRVIRSLYASKLPLSHEPSGLFLQLILWKKPSQQNTSCYTLQQPISFKHSVSASAIHSAYFAQHFFNLYFKCLQHYPWTVFSEDSGRCTVHLINRGVSVDSNSVTVEFGTTGTVSSLTCILDGSTIKQCEPHSSHSFYTHICTHMYTYINTFKNY